jgi:multidrug resistance efflux pump
VDGLRVTPAIVGLEISGPALLDARNKVTTTARIHGYLTTVNVDRNDPVKVGQVLAQLETEDVANQLATSAADAEDADRSISEARSDQERAHTSAKLLLGAVGAA